jgi:predicted nucleic acid-binding protein
VGQEVAMEIIVVADTGPLLHLYWIGAASWALPDCPIVVVESVLRELEKFAPEILSEVVFTRTADPQLIPSELDPWTLDDGERNALAYALALAKAQTVLLLCDDTRARRAATALGIEVAGTIGLLIQSAASGRRSKQQVCEALGDLRVQGGLHVSDRLIEWAVDEVANLEVEGND